MDAWVLMFPSLTIPKLLKKSTLIKTSPIKKLTNKVQNLTRNLGGLA
ncbi:hypothetical protein SE_1556 [Staphylococcus epidermidis ATCC 12228]|uniref:Uncharacterized protein n=1 Tax=Staphylococcus epidermidis (strain ATCC 12228 / FDA PCI 1200) TaxID=176280 RepID=A0A0H2VIL5_STAES|nr:hypothetical protein SE_1556 [Staphylococcus epidermidis ATCC 12228]